MFAGTVCSILSIAYCLSYAALIFTGPLEHLLSYGIAVTFLSAAVGGSIVALRSSLPFAVAGPDSSISVVLAALVATLVQRLVASGSTDLLEPALIAMALATALTGLIALRARLHACGPRNPLRALPGHWRLPRRDRLAADHRRDPGRHESAADARQYRRLRRPRDRDQDRARRRCRNHALCAAAPLQKPVHPARRIADGIRGDASRAAVERHDDRRRTRQRLVVPTCSRRPD